MRRFTPAPDASGKRRGGRLGWGKRRGRRRIAQRALVNVVVDEVSCRCIARLVAGVRPDATSVAIPVRAVREVDVPEADGGKGPVAGIRADAVDLVAGGKAVAGGDHDKGQLSAVVEESE